MRVNRFWRGVAGLALISAAVGCGDAGTSNLVSTQGISGPPPSAPTDELMKPSKSKRSGPSNRPPRGFGGPPPIPGR